MHDNFVTGYSLAMLPIFVLGGSKEFFLHRKVDHWVLGVFAYELILCAIGIFIKWRTLLSSGEAGACIMAVILVGGYGLRRLKSKKLNGSRSDPEKGQLKNS